MSEIKTDYRKANEARKKTFDEKYGTGITETASDICKRYGIDENSKLAHVIRNAMNKFILALDSRALAYSKWYNEQHEALGKLEDKFGAAMHSNTLIMIRSQKYQDLSPNLFIPLIRIDMGRSKAVLSTHRLLTRYIKDMDETKRNRERDPAYKILGSIIRSVIDLYHETNGKKIVVSFSNSPTQTVSFLREALKP